MKSQTQMKHFQTGMRAVSVIVLLGLGIPAPSAAATIGLQNATATYTQTNPATPGLWDPFKTIDGAVAGYFTSWAIYRTDGIQAESIVWETQADLTVSSASALTFNLYQQEYITSGGHNLGRFRLSYTTDDRDTFADGLANGGDVTANWVIIDPLTVTSSNGEIFTELSDSSILVSGTDCCYPTYVVTTGFAATGITGFRLEAMKDDSLPWGGPGRELSAGNFHLSEFVVTAVPAPAAVWLFSSGLALIAFKFRRRHHTINA